MPQRRRGPYVTPSSSSSRSSGRFTRMGRLVATRVSPSSVGRRALSAAAQGIAGLHPYGRTAMAGYQVAKGLYNTFKGPTRSVRNRGTQTSPPRGVKRNARGFSGASTGVYKGRFSKPKKIKRTIESLCLSQGMHTTVEQFGTISDPDCVFLSHSTGYINETGRVIAYALIRKIMTKAGFKITNLFNVVAATNPNAGLNATEVSTGLRFVYTKKNAIVANYTNYTYDTTGAQGFNDICNGFTQLQDQVIDWFRNANNDEPYKIAVYRRDLTDLHTNWNLAAEIFLADVSMELHFNSNLTIQNRTKAALQGDGTSAEQLQTDRVDAQPLKGMIYEFGHADHRVRHLGPQFAPVVIKDNAPFNCMKDNGLKLIRGGTYVGGQEPFVPKYFSNVTKATPVMINPGDMKKTSFYHKFSGTLTNLIKRLRVVHWDTLSSNFTGMMGKSQMVCLEELMRTPSTNLITIAYEREIKIGTIIKEKRRQAPLESRLLHEEVNSNAA